MPISRRDFLKTTAAAGAIAGMGNLPLHAEQATASSLVTLGKSGIKVTRLAFGTGSNNGYVQSSLGQKEFSGLVAYAYERGIRFFETSESYTTPAMLGEALKPFPRDSYVLMTKVTTDPDADPAAALRRHAPHLQYRILRHHASPLAAHARLGRNNKALGRQASTNSRPKRPSSRAAPASTACRLCARCPAIPGCKWP